MKRSITSASLSLLFAFHSWAARDPRAARSVHLVYEAPESQAFYSEMRIDETVSGSYFMAAGFDRGYFGLQDLGGGRQIALFSVWDPDHSDDPQGVAQERQVEILRHGEGVTARRFGGEGSGAQSLRPFKWELGRVYRFLVTADREDSKTTFRGFIYEADRTNWFEMASFRTITGGHLIRDPHTFVEDFRRNGESLRQRRSASYGAAWLQSSDGTWRPVRQARFSADGNTHVNIDAGVKDGFFYLATGGETKMNQRLWSLIPREPGGQVPSDLPIIRP